MSRARSIVPAGLLVLLLFWLPVLLVALAGWPQGEATAPLPAAPLSPIAEPAPPMGLSPDLIRWTLVAAAVAVGIGLGAWLLALVLRRELGPGAEAPAQPRPYLVAFLGLESLAVYGLNFLLPFPLRKYYSFKQVSIGVIAERNGEVALGTALATVALFLLYMLAHRLCRGQGRRSLWAVVLVGAVLFALVNGLVATITTLDPYDYVARGRITGLYAGNPYTLKPEDYPGDPFMDYVSWRGKTSAYGPLWETVSALLSRAAGGQLWPNMLAYKVLALLGYLGSVLLIAAILRRVAPERALAGTLLFAWNPLILMEGLANGHNDMLMLALLLAAFWALSQARLPGARPALDERPWDRAYGPIAMVLLGAAILVKFVPALLLPLFLLYLLAGEKPWWRWPVRGALLLLPLALLAVEYYLPFWQQDAVANTFTRRTDMFFMSTASVAKESLQQHMGAPTAAALNGWPFQEINPARTLDTLDRQAAAKALVTWPFLGAFALSYLSLVARSFWRHLQLDERWAHRLERSWQVAGGAVAGFLWGWLAGSWGLFPLATWAGISGIVLSALLWGALGAIAGAALPRRGTAGPREQPWYSLVRTSLYAVLLFLLLGNSYFWPWYLIVPIGLLALAGDERLVAPLALAACAGEVAHLGWNFLVYWWGITWDTWYQVDALVTFWTIVPALVVYAILGLGRQRAPAGTAAPDPGGRL